MFERIRAWRRERREKGAAADRACQTFRAARGIDPMGASVLSHAPRETIVRVMYYAGHIPPARAWYAVSADEVRELSYDDVAHLEGPWR